MRVRTLYVVLAVSSLNCLAQPYDQMVLREITAMVEPAGKLMEAKDPRAVVILEQALARLADLGPVVKDNFFVREAKLDLLGKLAQAHAKSGDRKAALDGLTRICADGAGTEFLAFVLKQRELKELEADPEYAKATIDCRRNSAVWDGFASRPYSPELPVEDRLAGLAKLWAEVKYNFYDPRRLADIGWDRLFAEYVGRVMRTNSTQEYYRKLQELAARVGDGHTSVYMPVEIEQARANPPLRIALIEDSVLILDVLNKPLRDEGVVRGVEILEIDGLPVHEHARGNVIPYIGQSTKQGLESTAYSYPLMRDSPGKPMRVKLRDASGKTWDRDLPRQGFEWERRSRPVAEFKVLGNGIGYFAANTFGNSKAASVFEEAMPEIQKTSSLIIDLRENSGGSSGVGNRILGCLTDEPFPVSRQRMRHYIPAMRARGVDLDFTEMEPWLVEPNRKHLYTKPVVVLAGANTASAAEDFLVGFRTIGRGKIVGEPSFGSTGQPLWFALPGGGSARVCTKLDSFPDGRQFVGVGVIPDILVRPTVASVRSGRDIVLDAAVQHLQRDEK